MNFLPNELFRTIEGDDWRRSLARSRTENNPVADGIRAKCTSLLPEGVKVRTCEGANVDPRKTTP